MKERKREREIGLIEGKECSIEKDEVFFFLWWWGLHL
jgi:hypothetical protein